MMTAAEANILRIENEKLRVRIELMQKISTTPKFFVYYFSKLSEFGSNKDCFDFLNDQYFEFFGEYKYSDYASFRVQLTKYNKK
ncbi:hypothetical protein [Flavobacterium sp. SLB02]|uniref:hypothetical protein n=1 Tax=Flavobacterium sp. SLB02 TaxID=2665645 RepID=UPI0012A89E04|nr:hypothetical protein [Flavobacterium sp. SLB02]QGK72837.1 hypothetical protein GIY83_01745 [Flavobacterium sp. SLB02]